MALGIFYLLKGAINLKSFPQTLNGGILAETKAPVCLDNRRCDSMLRYATAPLKEASVLGNDAEALKGLGDVLLIFLLLVLLIATISSTIITTCIVTIATIITTGASGRLRLWVLER